jgi:uncharacterized protein YbjT (DUF2867 family)
LIQISILRAATADRTAFSATKREAERLIAASGIAYAISRPGLVAAPAAYGGSALAALPVDLPADEAAAPFQPVAVEDVAATIAWLASREIGDEAVKAVAWDLMPPQKISLSGVVDQLRFALGIGVLIAFRRSSAIGLIAGIVASLGYIAGSAVLTPDLWIGPLGALVETGPAIVLMLVALLTLDNR